MPAPRSRCAASPYHAAEAYLARLIRRGFRVAVAEQMEDPKTRTGKAPIRREVVRLITPGTDHRGRVARRRPPQPVARPGAGPATASAPPGSTSPPACSKPPSCWRSNFPRCSAAWNQRRSWPPPPLPWATGRTSARPSRPLAAAGRPPPPGGSVRRRQPGRVRQLHRRRGGRRRAGARLRARHPGGQPAAPRPPLAAGPRRRAGDGRRNPRQPGNPARPRWRRPAHAVCRRAAHRSPRPARACWPAGSPRR